MEQRIDRLFERHKDCLERLSATELRAVDKRLSGRGHRRRCGTAKLICAWAGRLVLCLVAAVTLVATLRNELVSGGYATQSTEWLAALDLAQQKLVRRVSHALGLYDTELVRGMGRCLVKNPFRREAPLCCGCHPLGRVARVRVTHGNLTSVADLIDSLYSRAVSPFLVTGQPAELRVDFARLSGFVAEHRADFERGANDVRTLVSGAVRRFGDLFPDGPAAAEPPPGQTLLWSFYHLPAIRALRRLLPRPAYFGQRTERLQWTSLLIAGRRRPLEGGDGGGGGGFLSVGDFPGLQSLAFAVPLSGRLTARLALKAACCGGGGGGSGSSEVTLTPGRVLFFPTDCHELLVRQDSEGPALLYFNFLYNGAHQARKMPSPKD